MSDNLLSGKSHTNEKTDIHCFSCSHFFITHEPDYPYGCRAAGFKSRMLPAKMMHVYSGIACQLFKEKQGF
jgi:hypothetical protein